VPLTALGLCCQHINIVVDLIAQNGQHEAMVIL